MPRIFVLGAGQLGAMLHYSGLPLDIQVVPVGFDDKPIADLCESDLVTAEIERWPDTPVTRQLSCHPNFINAGIFAQMADRLSQKSTLNGLQIATSPWQGLQPDTDLSLLLDQLGTPCLLKRRTGGYDGRGQLWLDNSATDLADWRDQAIAEAKIAFDEEVSIIGVRSRSGEMLFFPLALNLHRDGILRATLVGLNRLKPLQSRAETMLGKLMQHLDYCGVMAMELFRVGDELLVNEVAPRVHNSGHWSLSGASVSQFEWHLRATAGLPLAAAHTKGASLMLNLIGNQRNDAWLSIAGVELWWYGKSVRPGRKLGHLNICGPGLADLAAPVTALRPHLPDDYQSVLDWVAARIS